MQKSKGDQKEHVVPLTRSPDTAYMAYIRVCDSIDIITVLFKNNTGNYNNNSSNLTETKTIPCQLNNHKH